jgi:hypothetical protein
MGKVPYSAKVKEAATILEARTLQLSAKQGCKITSRLLQRTFNKINIIYNRDTSLLECLANRKRAMNTYIELKKKGHEHRLTFMQQLAQARAAEGNTSAEKELIQLQAREQQRKQWLSIKRATGKLQGGGVTFVTELLQPNGTYKPLREKVEIEDAFKRANKIKYRQSYDTPMLNEPLLPSFGYLGLTENADHVMEGTFECPPCTNPYAI